MAESVVPVVVAAGRRGTDRVDSRVGIYESCCSRAKAARCRHVRDPQELSPPEEIRATITATRTAPRPRDFTDAVVDPVTNALICATRTSRARQTETTHREHSQLLRAALIGGPDALMEAQKMRIIGDSDTLSELHTAVWTSAEAHPRWRGAIGSVPAAAPHDGAEMRVALNTA